MTWQDAKQDALEMVTRITQSHDQSQELVLVLFDSAQTYRLLRGPADPVAWNYHTQVIRAAARLLRRPHGFKVRCVSLKRDEYMNWLRASDREHSPEALNEYAATLP